MPGFDDSSLMDEPTKRQRGLPGGYSNQGEMVSSPYQGKSKRRQVYKTNPENALSQMADKNIGIRDRVDNFIQDMEED
tara:strand:- start:237 stop:470 length:234 start_codon:yes stop_codon:yes gene_type:complete